MLHIRPDISYPSVYLYQVFNVAYKDAQTVAE